MVYCIIFSLINSFIHSIINEFIHSFFLLFTFFQVNIHVVSLQRVFNTFEIKTRAKFISISLNQPCIIILVKKGN